MDKKKKSFQLGYLQVNNLYDKCKGLKCDFPKKNNRVASTHIHVNQWGLGLAEGTSLPHDESRFEFLLGEISTFNT